MGHVLFVLLHLIALLFGVVWLIFTIPAHLIYAAVRANHPKPAPRPAPVSPAGIRNGTAERACPACAEPVLLQALKCKHCGESILAHDLRAGRRSANLDGLEEVNVVGESQYQNALGAMAALPEGQALLTAELMREPRNIYDRNAVRVSVAGHIVGYLPRELAAHYDAAVRDHYRKPSKIAPILTAPAEIRGAAHPYGIVVYLPEGLVDRLHA